MSVAGGERWWASLAHGGLLIAPASLARHFEQPAPPLSGAVAERLRRDVVRTRVDDDVTPLLDTVLQRVLDLDNDGDARWLAGPNLGKEWSHAALTRDIVRPRRVWTCGDVALPVFVPSEQPARLGVGRGRRTVARVIEWLRGTKRPIAVITNGRQWRLVWAGPEADAWAEWDTSLWFLEGTPGDQVTALRTLLGRRAVTPPPNGGTPPLLASIEESRRGQAALSDALGEQVREAVELLIRACGPAVDALGDTVTARDVYIAATRVVMRLVVVLFAEARELLPRDNPVYHASYSLAALRDDLERAGGAGSERLRHRHGAWGRVVGLVRLIHAGSAHQALPVQRYGGELFAPGDARNDDGVRRAVTAFESLDEAPSDAVVAQILRLLTRTEVTVRQGRTARRVDAPIDFSDLSTEYLGILYEGLLDYELRVAPPDDPVVFLALGDQPALPLSRLEGLDDRALAALVESVRRGPQRTADAEEDGEEASNGGSDTSIDDETSGYGAGEEAELGGVPVAADAIDFAASSVEANADARAEADARAGAWAQRAVRVGQLAATSRRRGRGAPSAASEAAAAAAARTLVARTVLPHERYLVRWGGTRKGAGTFYTPPSLAVPTVERTLRPLAYEQAADGATVAIGSWSPRRPEEILDLKVCDPAMGSGSFLVAALRYLADALFASLHAHSRIAAQGSRTVVTLAEGEPLDGTLSRETLPTAPDADDFESRLRARLKRHIVETCIYGVDIDPLAVELARLALWVETMDRELPFEFLDHRLKVGNSLVGCWFDRFAHYPLLAWDREGGDKGQTTLVHHPKDEWTKAIKAKRNGDVKSEMRETITRQVPLFAANGPGDPAAIHDEAIAVLGAMRRLPVHECDERARLHRERLEGSAAQRRLREAFDLWCAIWFWPPDQLEDAPTPANLAEPSDLTRAIADTVVRDLRFFHWELEFPDVFASSGDGFDAVVGNPPWDTVQPFSKEYFSNIDPLYRSYGKQEALARQRELFEDRPDEERYWLEYVARFKGMANFSANAGAPFGDGAAGGLSFNLGPKSDQLHGAWASRRATSQGYSDLRHPYRCQGGGKPYTYRMFLEVAHAVLRPGGRLGMIVPSGLYSDLGSSELRTLLLSHCQWEWLFAFENGNRIFDIHRSFKFGPVVTTKGGNTALVRSAFMRRDPAEWANPEAVALPYSRQQVERFSPSTRAFLEVRDRRDLDVLEHLYSDAVLLADQSKNGWKLRFSQGDFNMTSHSKLFPPQPKWESAGYHPDAYGRWIGPEGDIALPLYQGVMVASLNDSVKRWLSGTGLRARWEPVSFTREHVIGPQYLMASPTYFESEGGDRVRKVAYRRIARTTDERTWIGTVMSRFPAGDSVFLLSAESPDWAVPWAVAGVLSTFAFDWQLRQRLGGTNLSWFVLADTAIPVCSETARGTVARLAMRLGGCALRWADEWLRFSSENADATETPWFTTWAVTEHERLRLQAMLDSIVAALYGLDTASLEWVLRDCDHPYDALRSTVFTRALDPKGFWRVDKERDPELRQSVLTLAAFRDLRDCIAACGGDRDRGIMAFTSQNSGDGWMLPETLCLADLGLGRDDRGRMPQVVRSRLGERYLPWQLEQSAQESWGECERHARVLLGADGVARLQADIVRARGAGGVARELMAAEPRPPYGFAPDPLLPEAARAEQGRLEL